MHRFLATLPLFSLVLFGPDFVGAQSPSASPTISESPSATPSEAAEAVGHFDLEPINSAIERDLLVRAAGLPSAYKDEPRAKGDPILVEPWKGNTPELSADVGTVSAVFVSPQEGESQDQVKISFDFKPDGVVVRSSRVDRQELASGLSLNNHEDAVVHVYLDTGDKYGFAFAMPPIANPRGSLLRVGLLVCPRIRADTKGANSKNEAFGNTDLVLDHLEFDASAYSRGRLISGVSPGRAMASVLTTKNIARGELSIDEAYSSDPEAAVEYHFDASEKLTSIGDAKQSSGAIVATVDLHNSAGYRRITTMRDAVWIKLIDNVDGFVTQDSRGNNVKVGSGQCYAVFDEKRALNKFSKEPLVIPMDKLSGAGLGEETPTPTSTPRIAPGKKVPKKRGGYKFNWSLKRH